MQNRLFIAFFFLLIGFSVHAQITDESITKSFFTTYTKEPATAYTNLFTNNKWMKDRQSTIETSKIKLKDLIEQLGQYEGYEFITEKRAGQSYIVKSYLIKYERQPLRFTFVLYKPKDTWTLQNFTFDTDIDTELTDAAKIDRLKSNFE